MMWQFRTRREEQPFLVVPDFPEETAATFRSHTSQLQTEAKPVTAAPPQQRYMNGEMRCKLSRAPVQQQWRDSNLPVPKQVAAV